MPLSTAAPESLRPSPRQAILGLFIVGQLAFLLVANLLNFYQDAQGYLPAEVKVPLERVIPGYPARTGHAWEISDEAATLVRRWSQLTGQDQHWSLFAPSVFQVTGFAAIVLSWENEPSSAPSLARGLALWTARDPLQVAAVANLLQLRLDALEPSAVRTARSLTAKLAPTAPLEAVSLMAALPPTPAAPTTVVLFSENEPANRYQFFRVGLFRMRRYEGHLLLYLTERDDETPEQARERWAKAIRDHVSDRAEPIQAYLKWRLAAYRAAHPQQPAPAQVTLVERVYPILPPEDDSGMHWRGPEVHPLARWQPAVEWQSEYRPIERYNPVTERFESVQR